MRDKRASLSKEKKMKFTKILVKLLIAFVSLFAVTFTIYFTNSDMKLIRVIYDKLQPYYDNLKKDRKL